ncbi:uncharacterized protein BDR25DRAFT_300745 [Lindgomyces ingoldianus]|uniref:Uncharacterized protein n=1 Tax=Lindgomyces ingoldianus TaxID=673940 RepID=A0ACB6R9J1_9PLEO|nr:uncharacterized protein BDR25DRAFT_300745 [Lindgomyces ingoldianus]KAF2475757.1 hypothetical protein BDR25DRAFT_300745 [Lindgomyces ingoldianus]
MCDSTFALSQRGGHFFECLSTQSHSRLLNKLRRLLTSTQILQVHRVTPGFENSILVTYRDNYGQDRIESQDLPEELINPSVCGVSG